MNKVILMGRLTRNPDIRVSQNDSASKIARFTIAVDRRFQKNNDGQTADFISCVAFGKTAEFIEGYGHQGTKFVVTGRIQTGSYTKQDGTKVYTTDVVVEEVEFAESKSSSASGAEAAGRPNPANAVEGFMNIDDSVEDEGMPFN
ncbi:MAG TPA: single-stranded DNA-binding protein [Eubacterium sp.]|nr:single-stranded DNA-binding protein [Eubacterium sp.]HBZ52228.1 single-stranded DNA-binding protein [Eubacterium sp.]